jgi:hypothetical protein
MKAENELLQYSKLVQSIRIDHIGYEDVLDGLEEALDSVGKAANPVCIHIAGEYRTGKSCAIDDFVALHPAKRGPEGLRQSIIYARLPSTATVKQLVERLLEAFGDPSWHRGSISNQTARLLEYLRKTRCRMIILDEFQHLCDKGQTKKLYETSDWLKNLVEDQEWALVAAGLPESAAVINSNRQLQGRFDPTLTMPLFDWRNESDRAQFRGFVSEFVAQMAPFELPDLGGDELALRVFLATSGRVGLFAKLMDRAVSRAIRKRTTKIRLVDVADAYRRAIWFAPKFPLPGGPFLGDLSGVGTELIEQVIALAADDDGVHGREDGTVRLQIPEVVACASSKQRPGRQALGRGALAKQKEALRRAL